jgi:hypothetical protein
MDMITTLATSQNWPPPQKKDIETTNAPNNPKPFSFQKYSKSFEWNQSTQFAIPQCLS